MKKVKILHIILAVIIIMLILSINVMAENQTAYQSSFTALYPHSDLRWDYLYNPENFSVTDCTAYYAKYSGRLEEVKNAHLGNKKLTYKFDSSIPQGWKANITAGITFLTNPKDSNLTAEENNTAICTFIADVDIPNNAQADVPWETHEVDSSNHVTSFVVKLNPNAFPAPYLDAAKQKIVVAHEIGHGLGLAHVQNQRVDFQVTSIMYPSPAQAEPYISFLSEWDIIGINAMLDSCDEYFHEHDLLGGNGKLTCEKCGAWKYDCLHNISYTQSSTQHTGTCTACGKTFSAANHSYGKNTKCTVCNYPHPSNHTLKTTWDTTDEVYHWKACSASACDYIDPNLYSKHTYSYLTNKCTTCGKAHPSNHVPKYPTGSASFYLRNSTEHWIECSQAGCAYLWSLSQHSISRGEVACSVCGEMIQHTHDYTIYTSNGTSNHTKKCVCGDGMTETHSMVYVQNSSTQHSTKCSTNCGYTTTLVNHSWTYTSNGSSNHTKKCSGCGYIASSTESHSLTTVSNGSTNHSSKCSSCGYVASTTVHGMDWVQNSSTQHSTKCSSCSYTTELVNHGWLSGTCTYKYCGSCGYSTGSSSHSLVNGTCTYQSCSKCSYTTGSSTHSYSYVQNGETGHYQKCSKCNATTSTSSHSYSWVQSGSSGHYKKCGTCGYTTSTVAHGYLSPTSNGSSNHTKSCGSCGYSVTESHSMGWVQNGSAGHYTKCSSCGYTTSTVAHGWVTVNGVKKCGSCGYVQ